MTLKDKLVEMANRPDPKPFLFNVGQMSRVRSNISEDGQTPEYWDGAKVEILSRDSTPLFKTHVYKVRHLDNNPWTQRVDLDEHKWLLEKDAVIWPNK